MDGDTDYFDIVGGVLQGDTLPLYLFIICYVLRTSIDKMKDSSFKLAKKRTRRYLAQKFKDADYADDSTSGIYIPPQAETLLHSLELAAAGIGLYVNTAMCFYQRGDISTQNSNYLKLVDKFTFLGNSVSPTEKDFNT